MGVRSIGEWISYDERTTMDLGAALGRCLRAGDVVVVQGPLGAGKTRFVQGLARGVGVTDSVQSPSFILVQAYALPEGGQFYHVDLYRLERPEEAWELGLWDLFDEAAIIAIEWPERAAGWLPEPYLRVILTPVGETTRRIRIEAVGDFPSERLHTLEEFAQRFHANPEGEGARRWPGAAAGESADPSSDPFEG